MDTKTYLFEKQARIAQAIAHPYRIAILDFLKSGPQCVCDIAAAAGAQRSNVSRHLALMVNAGILESEKKGLKVIYKIKTPCILKFLDCLGQCFQEQAHTERQILEQITE